MGISWCDRQSKQSRSNLLIRSTYHHKQSNSISNSLVFLPKKYLGKGLLSTTIEVVLESLQTQKYAQKIIYLKSIQENYLICSNNQLEIIQKIFSNDSFVKVKMWTVRKQKLYITMQNMPKGDLYYHLAKQIPQTDSNYFSNRIIRRIAIELILILEQLHTHGIIYRRLKPENIFVTRDGFLKLSDYLFSLQNINANTYCGVAQYAAPEIFHLNTNTQHYTTSVDIWMLGVLLYQLMNKATPFQSKLEKIDQKLLEIQFNVCERPMSSIWEYQLNKEQKTPLMQLIQQLLNRNANQRLSIIEIKNHPFFEDIDWSNLKKQYIESLLILFPQDNIKFRGDLDCLQQPKRTLLSINNNKCVPSMPNDTCLQKLNQE